MTPTESAVKTLYWFFLYGFIGWGVEVVYAAAKTHKLVNRGFLCGPICPIYGFGMVGLVYSVSLIPMPSSGSMTDSRIIPTITDRIMTSVGSSTEMKDVIRSFNSSSQRSAI